MPGIELGPYRVNYGCLGESRAGVRVTPGGFPVVVDGNAFKATAVHPVRPVLFKASFDISVGAGAAAFYGLAPNSDALRKAMFEDYDPLLPPIRVGFVQNIVRCRRRVMFEPAKPLAKRKQFVEKHGSYPLLDRAPDAKDPWYRDRPGMLIDIRTGDFNFKDPGYIEHQMISVEDAPELTMPDPEDSYTALVDWADTFVTCTVAQVGTRFYCLHAFRWTVTAKGTLNALAASPTAGIVVSTDDYVLAPYTFPEGLQLDGALAQDSTMSMKFIA